ncbi:hypothetical protein PFISCL1PPCAC_5866 [Pristionchus fissidentatus]|uniref:Uncharacterized protein n=1 Tax=Pristionchus fissidentatus TaxID=1538716 RepID=A0AAV5V551_9BILA|nr:hypothetical protein PFISCL1PPCAC_5866 [Pristionchus fissidentatus]
MSRSLGDGFIVEILKTYAYVEDDKLGRVFFPIAAAKVRQNCFDLRTKFKCGDQVIFTALKQPDIKNGCAYIACSVVKTEELIEKTGKIAEKFDKFCYVDLPREGRVFVPYSARNGIGKSWLGRGSEVGVTVTIKYFCQPVINDCHFVAFTCEVRESVNPSTMKPVASQGGAHRSPEFVHEQIGCIVVWNGYSGDSLVYSAVTGLASLPSSLVQPYMGFGTWIRYIAHRNNGQCESRIGWSVGNPHDLGMLFPTVPYDMDGSRLQLELHAVVNRVDKKGRAAWMWNDQIGRIYVPPHYFHATLRSFDVVKITVCYIGQFEDVPWTAVKIEELGDDETIRDAVALMLHTCDTWRVTHVQMAQGTFYSFLEHSTFGSAFAAWTDYTAGETPPKQGMICRVTVYRQERDKKHIYRAVMVTPLDPTTKEPVHHHPAYSPGTKVPNGLAIPLPKAWKEAVPVARTRFPSPPGLSGVATRMNGMQQHLSMSEVVSGVRRRPAADTTASNESIGKGVFTPQHSQVSQFNGFHSNGCDLSPVIGNGITQFGGNRDSPTMSLPHSDMDLMSNLDLNVGDDDFFERAVASPTEAFLQGTPTNFYALSNDTAFNPWRPQEDLASSTTEISSSEHLAPGYRPPGSREMMSPVRNGSVSSSTATSTAEAETQTDMMTEHKVIREIMTNHTLLCKIFEVMPDNIQDILNISAYIKKAVDVCPAQ